MSIFKCIKELFKKNKDDAPVCQTCMYHGVCYNCETSCETCNAPCVDCKDGVFNNLEKVK